MARSILDTIGLAVTLAFAVPVGLTGAELLAGGDRLVGGALLVVAVLMVLLNEFLLTPQDIPAKVIKRVFGVALVDEDEDEE